MQAIMAGSEMLPVDVMPALARLASPLARLFTQTVAFATLFAAKPPARTRQTPPHPAFWCNIRVSQGLSSR